MLVVGNIDTQNTRHPLRSPSIEKRTMVPKNRTRGGPAPGRVSPAVAYAGDSCRLRTLSPRGPHFTRLAAHDDITIGVGPHNHCAGSARPAPAGYESLRRISIQPAAIDSCLEWWTVDLFVTDDGLISAITYDLWEP